MTINTFIGWRSGNWGPCTPKRNGSSRRTLPKGKGRSAEARSVHLTTKLPRDNAGAHNLYMCCVSFLKQTLELRRTQDEMAARLIADLWERGELHAPIRSALSRPNEGTGSGPVMEITAPREPSTDPNASSAPLVGPVLEPSVVALHDNTTAASPMVKVFTRLWLRHERKFRRPSGKCMQGRCSKLRLGAGIERQGYAPQTR